MLDKKRMITLILAIFILCSLSSVYASDIDDSAIQMSNDAIGDVVASEVDSEDVDSNVIASEANSEDVDSNAITSVEEDSDGDAIASVDEDVDSDAILSVEENNKESLAASNMHSFEELQHMINVAPEGSEINLTSDYSLAVGGTTIKIIAKSLTINGNGHTLYGAGKNRILDVNYTGSQELILKNIKFKNGGQQDRNGDFKTDKGGAIYFHVDGSEAFYSGNGLTIINCSFENNAAENAGGAIYSEGDVTISNSNFISNKVTFGNGGAVWCGRRVTVDNSRFDNNKVEHGLTTDDVTLAYIGMLWGDLRWSDVYKYFIFSGQLLIYPDSLPPSGGAIFCKGVTSIYNSNFNNNQVGQENEMGPGGGAIHSIGDITVKNCNFTANKAFDQYGGAIVSNRHAYIDDSNFRDNVANCGGAVATFGTTFLKRCTFSNNGHIAGTTFMESMSLEETLGEVPIIGDILEVGLPLLELLGVPSDFLTYTMESRGGAIISAACSAKSCEFDNNHASDYGGAIDTDYWVTVEDCTFTSNSVYRGNNAVHEALNFQGRVRDGGAISCDENVTVKNSYFTGNSAPVEGGAIYCGKFEAYDSGFSYNSARFSGGAVKAKTIGTVSNCEFIDNQAIASSGDGGAVYIVNPCNPTFKNCKFDSNQAESDGGAIFVNNENSILSLSQCTFLKNLAATDGGAVYCRGQTSISNSVFNENQATGDGSIERSFGGAVNSQKDLTIKYCSFTKNFANNWGGAAYSAGKMIIQNSNFTSNSAHLGGALYATVLNDEVTNSRFIKNSATDGDGGAIYIDEESWPKFKNCVFQENSCRVKLATEKAEGGAIYGDKSHLKVTNCNFTVNYAHHGGAIYVSKVTEISGSKFSKNQASPSSTGDGGAIYVNKECSFTIRDCTFDKNVAGDRGGAIYTDASGSTVKLSNSNFTSNRAKKGGAIYVSKIVSPSNLVFIKNNATTGDGGAVYINKECYPEFIGCRFENNTAENGDGGGMYFYDNSARVKLTSCSFIGNKAIKGGGMYVDEISTIQKTSFINNNATDCGGGIYIDDQLTGDIISCTFQNNFAKEDGGGVCAPSAEMKKIQSSTFTGNEAANGGGIFINRVSMILDSFFYNNVANSTSTTICDGGAVYVDGLCTFTVIKCVFVGNRAKTRGGAIYADYHLWPYYVHMNVSYCSFYNNTANCVGYDKNNNLYHGPGHSIFNSGYYDFIGWCWHGSNNPDFTGQIVEYHESGNDEDIMPAGILKIGMRLSEPHPVAGNTYKVTIYFQKNNGGNLDHNIWHSNGIFYGDGEFSNIQSANKNSVTADVVFNSESRNIYGRIDSEVLSLRVDPAEKDPCTVNIISCDYIHYPETLVVNYEINPMFDAIYEIRDLDGKIVKNGTLNNPNTLRVDGLLPGDYYITITNLESEFYLSGSDEAFCYVMKGYLDEFSIVVYNATSNKDVKGFVYSSADENFTVKVGEITTEVVVKDHWGNFNLGKLDVGNYEAEVLLLNSAIYEIQGNYTTFTVSDEATLFEIDVGDGEFDYTEDIVITPILPDGATGTITYSLIDGTFLGETQVGESFTMHMLNVGSYIIVANYSGDGNFASALDIAQVKVNKMAKTPFSICGYNDYENHNWFFNGDVYDVAKDKRAPISSVLPEGATGTVKYYINGTFLAELPISENYTIPKWNVGLHVITAEYSGDSNLYPASAVMYILINYQISEFGIWLDRNIYGSGPVYTIEYGETPNIYYQHYDGVSGLISYYDNGVLIGNSTYGWDQIFALPVLEPGPHEISAKFSNEYSFILVNVRTNETEFEVNVVDDEISYGETTVVIHVLPENATGTIRYYLSNGTFLGEAPVDKNFTLPILEGGIQGIYAEYSGDKLNIHANANTTLSISASEVAFEAEISSSEIAYCEEVSINHLLPDIATGTILYYLSDGTFLGEAPVGESFTLPNLTAGTYEIFADYSGDNSFLPANYTVSLTVNPTETFEFNAEGSEFGHGEEAEISPVLPDDATGTIAYYLSDGTLLGETGVGESFTIPKLDAGTHEIVVNYSGDSNYVPATYSVSVTVNQVETPEFSLPDIIFDYGEKAKISPVLPDDATGTLNYYLSDGTFIGAVAAGESFTLPAWDAGIYGIVVKYSGDSNYAFATDSADIIVKKTPSKLKVSMVLDYNGVGTTYASFDDAKGIEASVLDQPNAIVTVSGNAITVSGLDVGTYTLRVTTITDGNHIPVTETTSVIVNKAKTALTASAVTATYNVNKNLVATLKDAKGKALSGVKVNVVLSNGKKLTLTTDKNGQIKVSTKGLAPKTYTATITFAGNKNCLKSTKTVKITVKKASPKLTAKAQSFKKSLKTKKYVVTLKNNVNKAMAKTQVTIKVGGTTYKATTNAKGQATFKMTKLNKKGTFTAVITYKGSANYNKVTKKVKITVK